jgi:hypothetical protein
MAHGTRAMETYRYRGYQIEPRREWSNLVCQRSSTAGRPTNTAAFNPTHLDCAKGRGSRRLSNASITSSQNRRGVPNSQPSRAAGFPAAMRAACTLFRREKAPGHQSLSQHAPSAQETGAPSSRRKKLFISRQTHVGSWLRCCLSWHTWFFLC